MAKKFSKYVYAVDIEAGKVIDTTAGLSDMKRRIARKEKMGKPYAESVIFVQADITAPLLQLDTDELLGYHMITNAILAGLVAGVDAKTVMERLEAAGYVQTVDWSKVRMIGS